MLISLVVFPTSMYAHDLATHMYIASKTFDIWQDFDPQFYRDLTGPRNEYIPMLTRKFYYIGCMLPDMFTQQDYIKSIIDRLYHVRDTIIQIAGTRIIHIQMTGPLYIQDITEAMIQAPLISRDEDDPHRNLDKLREMVLWARDHCRYSYEKAMIYGCYMHVVHDIYAHEVLQPSRFGYGLAVEPPQAEEDAFLQVPELYYEYFSQTYIDDWSFILDLYLGWDITLNEPVIGDFQFYFQSYTPGETPEIYASWQDYEFWGLGRITPVEKFTEASTEVGYIDSTELSYWKLKSYLHGLAIGVFMIYGYRMDEDYFDTDIGGIMAHPEWKLSDIASFEATLLQRWVSYNFPFNILDLLESVIFNGSLLIPFDPEKLQIGFLGLLAKFIAKCDVEPIASFPYAWSEIIQDTAKLDQLWNALCEVDYDVQEYEDYYQKMRAYLVYYQRYAAIKKPNLRSTYSEEEQEALNLKNLYKAHLMSILEGEPFLSTNAYNNIVARKSGVLGGIIPIPSDKYYRQPGVFDIHFEKDGNPVYTTVDIPLEGPGGEISLKYSLISLGPFIVSVHKVGQDDNHYLTYERFSDSYKKLSGAINCNVQDLVEDGEDTVYFCVRTRHKFYPHDYATMLKSDYREYFDNPAISNNNYYLTYFNEGNPVRTSG